MKLECVHTDTCLPDYFSGDARPWVCIPVRKSLSLKSIKQDLHSEINQGAIGGNNPLTRDDSGPEGDKWFKAAHAAINRMKPAVKGQKTFFKDAEDPPEDGDCVMAYFVFVVAD